MADYIVKKACGKVDISAGFNEGPWQHADIITLPNRPSDKKHPQRKNAWGPGVEFKLLYDAEKIYGMFEVQDHYVRVTHYGYQQSVCRDSCVEFFVRPVNSKSYFNFELSGGGAMLLYQIVSIKQHDLKRIPTEDCMTIERFHTLPTRVNPEWKTPTTWRLGFAIPISFFVKFSGIDPNLKNQVWTANVTKCADHSSHPHWCSWQPLPEVNFHRPDCFGSILFE